MLTTKAMLKIRYWICLYVEVSRLQARAQSTSSPVPKVPCMTPLAVHLQMCSSAGADNILQLLRCTNLDILGITHSRCAKVKEKKKKICAFLCFLHLSNVG